MRTASQPTHINFRRLRVGLRVGDAADERPRAEREVARAVQLARRAHCRAGHRKAHKAASTVLASRVVLSPAARIRNQAHVRTFARTRARAPQRRHCQTEGSAKCDESAAGHQAKRLAHWLTPPTLRRNAQQHTPRSEGNQLPTTQTNPRSTRQTTHAQRSAGDARTSSSPRGTACLRVGTCQTHLEQDKVCERAVLLEDCAHRALGDGRRHIGNVQRAILVLRTREREEASGAPNTTRRVSLQSRPSRECGRCAARVACQRAAPGRTNGRPVPSAMMRISSGPRGSVFGKYCSR